MLDALQQAVSQKDQRAIRMAVDEAREAGVSREILRDALASLRRLELAEMLERAIDTANAEIVKAAISRARVAGAEENIVRKAELAMQHLEVRKMLRIAVTSCNPDMVSLAVSKARDAGVDENVIKEAQNMVRVLDARKHLRKSLKDMTAASLEESLTEARCCLEVQTGNEANKMLKDLVVAAEKQLALAKDQDEARQLLGRAICSGTEKDLRFAISIAQHTKLDAPDIERAEVLLRQLLARADLQEALAAGKFRAIESTIARAKAAGLPEHDVEKAEEALRQIVSEQAERSGDLDRRLRLL
jgi:hypothetical protein